MDETEGIVVGGATGRASELILLLQLYLLLLHHLLLLRLIPHSGSSCSAPDQELYLQLPPTSAPREHVALCREVCGQRHRALARRGTTTLASLPLRCPGRWSGRCARFWHGHGDRGRKHSGLDVRARSLSARLRCRGIPVRTAIVALSTIRIA